MSKLVQTGWKALQPPAQVVLLSTKSLIEQVDPLFTMRNISVWYVLWFTEPSVWCVHPSVIGTQLKRAWRRPAFHRCRPFASLSAGWVGLGFFQVQPEKQLSWVKSKTNLHFLSKERVRKFSILEYFQVRALGSFDKSYLASTSTTWAFKSPVTPGWVDPWRRPCIVPIFASIFRPLKENV